MSKMLLLASLVLSVSAAADPPVKGVPVFEIDRFDGTRAVSITKLYGSGAWTVERTDVDHHTTMAMGVASSTLVTHPVRTLLANAPWKISHPIHCMMATSQRTAYYADGTLLFTERACNDISLDDRSAAALTDIVNLVDNATKG